MDAGVDAKPAVERRHKTYAGKVWLFSADCGIKRKDAQKRACERSNTACEKAVCGAGGKIVKRHHRYGTPHDAEDKILRVAQPRAFDNTNGQKTRKYGAHD